MRENINKASSLFHNISWSMEEWNKNNTDIKDDELIEYLNRAIDDIEKLKNEIIGKKNGKKERGGSGV